MNCARAICYDEAVYPDPHTYDPTRFLDQDGRIDPSVKAPETRIFGSGRRYGFLCYAHQLLEHLLQQDLSWTPSSDPDVVSHHRACSRYVRYPPPCRRQWAPKNPRGQIPQRPYTVSLWDWRRNGIDLLTTNNWALRHAMPFECIVKPRSEKAAKLIYDGFSTIAENRR